MKRCGECGSRNLYFALQKSCPAGIADGRLRMTDVTITGHLVCGDCESTEAIYDEATIETLALGSAVRPPLTHVSRGPTGRGGRAEVSGALNRPNDGQSVMEPMKVCAMRTTNTSSPRWSRPPRPGANETYLTVTEEGVLD